MQNRITLNYAKPIIFFGLAILFVFILWSYSNAESGIITACVRKDGLVHIIGDGFRRTDCKEKETLLSWNTQGPQGIQGPQGEQGLPAQTGAGNIAFYYGDSGEGPTGLPLSILTMDGHVFSLYDSWIAAPLAGIDPPIPVADIIQWHLINLLDKNGDVWKFNPASHTWGNFGHP